MTFKKNTDAKPAAKLPIFVLARAAAELDKSFQPWGVFAESEPVPACAQGWIKP